MNFHCMYSKKKGAISRPLVALTIRSIRWIRLQNRLEFLLQVKTCWGMNLQVTPIDVTEDLIDYIRFV